MQPRPSDAHAPGRRRRLVPMLAGLVVAGVCASEPADAGAPPSTLQVVKLPPAALGSASRAVAAAVQPDLRDGQSAFVLGKQAFAVTGGSRTLYLVPVNYASRKSLNAVCDLMVLDEHFRITGRARLFGADNTDEEALARCTNVLAAAFRARDARHLDGVYLMATGVINTTRNAAEVVAIDTVSGQVVADDKRTAAIDDGKEAQSVGPLMARLERLP